MEAQGQSFENVIAQAKTNIDKFIKLQASPEWQQNGVMKGEKPCLMYKAGIDSRVASKGVVANVEGTLEEFAQLVETEDAYFILNPEMKEFKKLKRLLNTPEEKIDIHYIRFKGMGPVSDRDFVIVERFLRVGDKIYVVDSSCDYPYPEDKGIVRGTCIISGFLVEKIDEKTIKVTYLSDGDIKGSIPSFVKNMVSQSQGGLASKVNDCLKELRARKVK